jgi:hypothetical protein
LPPVLEFRPSKHPVERAVSRRAESAAYRTNPGLRDKRFADYLASNLECPQALFQRRRVQENRAIVLGVMACLAVYWLVCRIFF